MATHVGFQPVEARTSPQAIARYVAVGAATVAALLYVLIGFEVVSIGQPSGTPDLLGFGLTAGGAYLALAVILFLVKRRIAWIPIAFFDVAVIVGYFAMANLRDPAFEVFGLLIKAAQVVMLAALTYLIFRPRAQTT